jgi:putative Holliday junction resolvase
MNSMELLGLDIGLKRTGIARASSVARLAEPLTTADTEQLLEIIDKLIKENSVEAVVVGLPRNLSGEDTQQTKWVRQWVAQTKPTIPVPMYWQDEALTSRLAEAEKNDGKKNHSTDALAAAIILQDFLDSSKAERVVC